jgi:sugar/nucleoside kinase (ribokinase family)
VTTFGVDRMAGLVSKLGVRVLFMNEGEADAIQRHRALEILAPQVVVHRGASSSRFYSDGQWEETSSGIVAEAAPVDPTGAGDAFAAGYIARAVHGGAPRASVEHGHEIAQIAIRMPGGQPPVHR